MNARTQSAKVVVACDPQGSDAALVAAYLRDAGVADAAWYARRDAAELDKAVRAGGVQRVVFPTLAELLLLLSEEVLTVEAWQASGVCIGFARPAQALSPTEAADILARWLEHRRRRRRQRAVAGLVLSVAALAVACAVLLLAGAAVAGQT